MVKNDFLSQYLDSNSIISNTAWFMLVLSLLHVRQWSKLSLTLRRLQNGLLPCYFNVCSMKPQWGIGINCLLFTNQNKQNFGLIIELIKIKYFSQLLSVVWDGFIHFAGSPFSKAKYNSDVENKLLALYFSSMITGLADTSFDNGIKYDDVISKMNDQIVLLLLNDDYHFFCRFGHFSLAPYTNSRSAASGSCKRCAEIQRSF